MKRMLVAISLLCCMCTYSPLRAQEEFVMPPAVELTKFHFTMISGGIVILKATLDNFPDSLNFILDTGSGGISLDSLTTVYLGLSTEQTNRTIRGIAGVKKVSFAYGHTLRMPGLEVKNLDFHINDYELLSTVYGIKIDGIIGFSFLRRYIVALDYDEHTIKVYTPGSFRYPKGGQMLRPEFTSLPFQVASVKDENTVTGKFIFDTGAGLTFLLSKEFAADSVRFKRRRKVYSTQVEGLGGKKVMDVTVMKEIRLGSFKFKNVPVHVFDDEYNVTNYPMLGGLIGNDIMRRFNTILNYPQRSIYITPNTHFNDRFDYSYTGLGIYQVNGEIRVEDIIPGSPGDKAGFKVGDIIFSVEHNYTKNIQAYKNIFQHTSGKVKVIVFRDQQPILLTINVKDIRR